MKSVQAATSAFNGGAISPHCGVACRTRAMWAVAALSLGVAAAVAPAATIDWVQWTDGDGTAPGGIINGTGSGLTVTGTFTHKPTGAWAPVNNIPIADSTWPYSDNEVDCWAFAQQSLSTTARFAFSNAGGLATGGSLALIDVEHANTSIQVKGYQKIGDDYMEVAVTWAYNAYTINPSSLPAIWNASTNTLTGAGVQVGGNDTFSMLTSNIRLDRVDLIISTTADDGIGIAFTSSNINAAANAVPGAGLAGLATAGLAGTTRRRRR